MAARRGPWVVAAVVQAIVIGFLSVHLATRETAAADDANAASRAHESVPAATPASSATAARELPVEATAPTLVPAAANGTGAHAAPVAELGTVLHGSVHARDRSSPQWAMVQVFVGEEPKPVASQTVAGSLTDFAFAGFAAGDYRLTARAEGFREFERSFSVPPGLPSLCIDVDLQPSWIVKVVLQTPDGGPLHEALAGEQDLAGLGREPVQVIAAWRQLPTQLPLTDGRETSISVGTWASSRGFRRGRGAELPARYAGTLEMREQRDAVVAAVLREAVLVQQPVAAGQEEVTLIIDPQQIRAQAAGLRLQVVDAATGAPVPGAKVGLNDAQSWQQPTAADGEGRYERTGLRPGRYSLSVLAEGREATAEVDLAPGRITDVGTVVLAELAELRIRVPELADEAQASCTLQVLGAVPNPMLRPRQQRLGLRKGEVDAKVVPGRYLLRVTHKGGGAQLELDTQRVGTEPLVVTLVPEPSLRIDPREIDEPVRCEVRSTNGQLVYDRWVTWTRTFDVQLPVGTYRVSVTRLDGPPRDEMLTVPPQGTTYLLH